MKSYDYDAVTFDADEWCTGCAPEHDDGEHGKCSGDNSDCEDCSPIFADAELDRWPVCGNCGAEHTYMGLTEHGARALWERTRHTWDEGMGRFSLELTGEQAYMDAGAQDENIAALRRVPAIAEQLDALDPAEVRESLKEAGAWSEDELADHEDNLLRVLFLACGELAEEFRSGRWSPE